MLERTLFSYITLFSASFCQFGHAQTQEQQSLRTQSAFLSQAQAAPSQDTDRAAILNANTVTIVSGPLTGTYATIAADMAAVLDNGDNLRILPIIGKGSAQNIRDILYLKGVDMGIVQSNVLRYFNKSGEAGANIERRLRYITRLYNQEIHILARSEINSIQDLRGKRVNFAEAGSGTQITAQLLFESLGIPVTEVNMGQPDAFEKMKAGELDATIFSAGKPVTAFGKLNNDKAFKFLNIPYSGPVTTDFLPAVFKYEDYPNIIPKDTYVETIAESSTLVTFNWPVNSERYRRVALFTDALFEKFDKFLVAPRHPKWKDVNLATNLEGWTRFQRSTELLERNNAKPSIVSAQDPVVRKAFQEFLNQIDAQGSTSMSGEQRDKLFQQFVEWRKSQPAP